MIRVIFTFLIFVLSGQAMAETPRSQSLITAAENYLNGLYTAQARFVQTGYDGSQAIGTFYLNRPGRLRFEYDEPIEDFVVADGFLIYFYDSELGEQSNAPIGTTLADFILRPELRLSGDIQVTGITRGNNMVQISIVQSADPEAGSLTLGFTNDPFALKKWRVTDSMGNITEIELFQMQTGLELADNLFIYNDPKRFKDGSHYRFND